MAAAELKDRIFLNFPKRGAQNPLQGEERQISLKLLRRRDDLQ